MLKIYDGRTEFYQWDINQKLIVEDETITEVHFCNRTDDCSLVCEVYQENELNVVNVPNILLQDIWTIKAFAYCNGCYTKQAAAFKVNPRSKPADYVYTETEVRNWERMEEQIEEAAAEIEENVANTMNAISSNFANALFGEKSGNSITFDDISPLQGTLKISVESKNLVPTAYHQNYSGNTTTIRGITFTTNEDGSITMNGKFDETGDISFFLVSSTTKPFVLQKGTYIGSTGQTFAALSFMKLGGGYSGFGTPITFFEETKFQYLYISMQKHKITGKTFNDETLYPMLMRGTVCEDFTAPKENGTVVDVFCGGDDDDNMVSSAVGETFEVENITQDYHIYSASEEVVLYAEYNKDINKAFEELQLAIISLGGNV